MKAYHLAISTADSRFLDLFSSDPPRSHAFWNMQTRAIVIDRRLRRTRSLYRRRDFSRKIALIACARMEVGEIRRTFTHMCCDTGARKISSASLEVGLIKPGDYLTRLTRPSRTAVSLRLLRTGADLNRRSRTARMCRRQSRPASRFTGTQPLNTSTFGTKGASIPKRELIARFPASSAPPFPPTWKCEAENEHFSGLSTEASDCSQNRLFAQIAQFHFKLGRAFFIIQPRSIDSSSRRG